jgi:hypothetical protein
MIFSYFWFAMHNFFLGFVFWLAVVWVVFRGFAVCWQLSQALKTYLTTAANAISQPKQIPMSLVV